MRKQLIVVLLIIVQFMAHAAHGDEIVLELKNPLTWARTHCPVSVSREELGIDESETIANITINRGGHDWSLPYQLDNRDGNGKWDELFFIVNIDTESSADVVVKTSSEPVEQINFDKRVNAVIDSQPREPWVVHKPVWESEFAVYTTYGAAQIDIIGKTYPRLVVDHYFGDEPQSPHEFSSDYGFDYLHLGNTMGLHALFIREPDGSIQRPWTTNGYAITQRIERDARFDSQVITAGPLRAIVRQWIAGWVTDAGRYACEITYSISALQRHTDVLITFTEFPGQKDELRIGVGMKQMYEDIHYEKTGGYMTAVAENVHDHVMMARLHGRAIVIPARYKAEELHIPDDPALSDMPFNGPNYALIFPKGETTLKYAFVGAWENDGGITSLEQWQVYLSRLAQELDNPLTVRVKR